MSKNRRTGNKNSIQHHYCSASNLIAIQQRAIIELDRREREREQNCKNFSISNPKQQAEMQKVSVGRKVGLEMFSSYVQLLEF